MIKAASLVISNLDSVGVKKGFEPKIYLPEAHFVDSSPQSAQTDSAGASGEYFRMPDEAILEIMK